jgi:hypothetical protein
MFILMYLHYITIAFTLKIINKRVLNVGNFNKLNYVNRQNAYKQHTQVLVFRAIVKRCYTSDRVLCSKHLTLSRK